MGTFYRFVVDKSCKLVVVDIITGDLCCPFVNHLQAVIGIEKFLRRKHKVNEGNHVRLLNYSATRQKPSFTFLSVSLVSYILYTIFSA